MSTIAIAAATIVAVYDTRETAGRAADAATAARIPDSVVSQIGPSDDAAAELRLIGLSMDAADRCLEHLAAGRSLVIVTADPLQSSSVETILRMQGAAEVAVHSGDITGGDGSDSALPPSVRSIAAQTGRPRGHRDPSA